MQQLQTVYVDQYMVDCVHGDCDGKLIVRIERERGGVVKEVAVAHADRQTVSVSPTTTNGDTVNGRRIRSQHSP